MSEPSCCTLPKHQSWIGTTWNIYRFVQELEHVFGYHCPLHPSCPITVILLLSSLIPLLFGHVPDVRSWVWGGVFKCPVLSVWGCIGSSVSNSDITYLLLYDLDNPHRRSRFMGLSLTRWAMDLLYNHHILSGMKIIRPRQILTEGFIRNIHQNWTWTVTIVSWHYENGASQSSREPWYYLS